MLKIKRVSKYYGATRALENVSLSIPKGTCYGFVGPNGAGKTTLIKMIATIIQQYEGSIEYNQSNDFAGLKQKLGYVPQEICLEQTVTAYQNLYFFGKLYGLKSKQLVSRAEEVLAYIGLSERGKDKVHTFSGGMKRRLNIGCALMNEPTIMIMDEPTVGIDPQSRRYIFNMIRNLRESGCTIIYASHDMEEVEALCDELAFIDKGKVIEKGRVDDLLQRYSTPSLYIKGENCLPENTDLFETIIESKGGFLLTTTTPLLAMETVLAHCRENSSQVERLELVQSRLEDVFFSLTGNQLRQ